jgi:conjugal transfer pilus assembly protein TraD
VPEQRIYEIPGRPNYAIAQSASWALGTGALFYLGAASDAPQFFFATSAVVAAGLAARTVEAIKYHQKMKKLFVQDVEFINLKQLKKRMPKGQALYLGEGGSWGQDQAQKTHDMMKFGLQGKIEANQEKLNKKVTAHNEKRDKLKAKGKKAPAKKYNLFGAYWLQAILDKQEPIQLPFDTLEGHTLIPGTTGSGKTRLLSIWILQMALRGEPVIVVDPKGDDDLEQACRQAAAVAGDASRFALFDLARPEDSVSINPLREFQSVSELTSRVVSNLPDGKDPTFKDFVYQEVDTIFNAMVYTGKVPTLAMLYTYVVNESALHKLFEESIEKHHREQDSFQEYSVIRAGEKGANQAEVAKRAHQKLVANKPEYGSALIDSLISRLEHDKAHLTKLIGSLKPLLIKLTSGHLSNTLSPDLRKQALAAMRANGDILKEAVEERYGYNPRYSEEDDFIPVDETLTFDTVVEQGMILYVRTDSLVQNEVASVVGSIFLSDMAAYAGRRYSYDKRSAEEEGRALTPINLFIDETNEVMNDTTIQLLNKGRGAGFRLVLATQTIADLTVRLNSKDAAMKTLGNLNNIVALRLVDEETQKFVAGKLQETDLLSLNQAYRAGTGTDSVTEFAGHVTETLSESKGEVFPAPYFGKLPNLHFLGVFAGGRVVKGKVPIFTEKAA